MTIIQFADDLHYLVGADRLLFIGSSCSCYDDDDDGTTTEAVGALLASDQLGGVSQHGPRRSAFAGGSQ